MFHKVNAGTALYYGFNIKRNTFLYSWGLVLQLPLFFTRKDKYYDIIEDDFFKGLRMLTVNIRILPIPNIHFGWKSIGEQTQIN